MRIIGVDLGNKSRNGIVLLDKESETIIDWMRFDYVESNPWEHRRNIILGIKNLIEKNNLSKDDWIIFEKINLYRGGYISHLSNITSLAFIQATIINEFSEIIGISEVNVQSWKKAILGSAKATKDDSVEFVQKNYPDLDLNVTIHYKRKADKIVQDNDTADACCIALYGCRYVDSLNEHRVNFT